jgi:hypothetical protein
LHIGENLCLAGVSATADVYAAASVSAVAGVSAVVGVSAIVSVCAVTSPLCSFCYLSVTADAAVSNVSAALLLCSCCCAPAVVLTASYCMQLTNDSCHRSHGF